MRLYRAVPGSGARKHVIIPPRFVPGRISPPMRVAAVDDARSFHPRMTEDAADPRRLGILRTNRVADEPDAPRGLAPGRRLFRGPPPDPDRTNATLATSPVRALMTLLPAVAVRLHAAGTGRSRAAATIP